MMLLLLGGGGIPDGVSGSCLVDKGWWVLHRGYSAG
jgi:hypothetical protein